MKSKFDDTDEKLPRIQIPADGQSVKTGMNFNEILSPTGTNQLGEGDSPSNIKSFSPNKTGTMTNFNFR